MPKYKDEQDELPEYPDIPELRQIGQRERPEKRKRNYKPVVIGMSEGDPRRMVTGIDHVERECVICGDKVILGKAVEQLGDYRTVCLECIEDIRELEVEITPEIRKEVAEEVMRQAMSSLVKAAHSRVNPKEGKRPN